MYSVISKVSSSSEFALQVKNGQMNEPESSKCGGGKGGSKNSVVPSLHNPSPSCVCALCMCVWGGGAGGD